MGRRSVSFSRDQRAALTFELARALVEAEDAHGGTLDGIDAAEAVSDLLARVQLALGLDGDDFDAAYAEVSGE